MRFLVCIYGVLGRSLDQTERAMEKTIFSELKNNGIDFDLALFNNNIGDALIDGNKVDNEIYKKYKTKYIYYEEHNQDNIDNKLRQHIKYNYNSYFPAHNQIQSHNGLRQLFIENQVSQYIRKKKDKYTKVIAIVSDMILYKPININFIINTNFNEVVFNEYKGYYGYCDGFYSGDLNGVINVMNGYQNVNKIREKYETYGERKIKKRLQRKFSYNNDTYLYTYEYLIKVNANMNKVSAKFYQFKFRKARARKQQKICKSEVY